MFGAAPDAVGEISYIECGCYVVRAGGMWAVIVGRAGCRGHQSVEGGHVLLFEELYVVACSSSAVTSVASATSSSSSTTSSSTSAAGVGLSLKSKASKLMTLPNVSDTDEYDDLWGSAVVRDPTEGRSDKLLTTSVPPARNFKSSPRLMRRRNRSTKLFR